MQKKDNRKVFILGLDGGTWKILNPLMEKGIMPNLKELVEDGASGTLQSTIPPVTAPAWTSFQTGVNPGKHGIFDFQAFDPESKKSEVVNGKSIPVDTVWDLLSSKGKNTITVNVPLTYPPKEDNRRITVGGMLSPEEDEGMVYPPSLFDSLLKEKGYKVTGGALERRISLDLSPFVREEFEVERKRFEVADHLLKTKNWDVFMLHVQGTDGIQHCFYPFLDPNSPDFDQGKFNVVSDFYSNLDREIGALFSNLPENEIKLIVSDHGFKQLKRYMNLNAWLREEKLLTPRGVNLKAKIVELIRKYDVFRLRKRIFARLLSNFISLREIITEVNTPSIDWKKTKAFMPNGTIYGGIFFGDEVENKDQLAKDLTIKLSEFIDDEKGKSPIKNIFAREDTYSGPFLNLLPELLLQPSEGYSFGVPMVEEKNIFRDVEYPYDYLGTHEREGIMVINGPGINAEREIDAHITDLSPTILALMGLDVPGYMDGTVREELFNYDLDYKIKKTPLPIKEGRDRESSAGDSEQVKERLEDLGYL